MGISTISRCFLSALFFVLGLGYANAQADYTLDTSLGQNKEIGRASCRERV